MKKSRGRKSRETIPLRPTTPFPADVTVYGILVLHVLLLLVPVDVTVYGILLLQVLLVLVLLM
jgi:hypothetical protein